MREFGRWDAHVSQIAGFNSRLDELQASILRVKLSHLARRWPGDGRSPLVMRGPSRAWG